MNGSDVLAEYDRRWAFQLEALTKMIGEVPGSSETRNILVALSESVRMLNSDIGRVIQILVDDFHDQTVMIACVTRLVDGWRPYAREQGPWMWVKPDADMVAPEEMTTAETKAMRGG